MRTICRVKSPPGKEIVPVSTAQDTGEASASDRRKHSRKTDYSVTLQVLMGQKTVACPAGTYFFLFNNPNTPPRVCLSGTSELVSSETSPHIPSFPWWRWWWGPLSTLLVCQHPLSYPLCPRRLSINLFVNSQLLCV